MIRILDNQENNYGVCEGLSRELEQQLQEALPASRFMKRQISYRLTVEYVAKRQDNSYVMGAAYRGFNCDVRKNIESFVRYIIYGIQVDHPELEVVYITKIKKEINE